MANNGTAVIPDVGASTSCCRHPETCILREVECNTLLLETWKPIPMQTKMTRLLTLTKTNLVFSSSSARHHQRKSAASQALFISISCGEKNPAGRQRPVTPIVRTSASHNSPGVRSARESHSRSNYTTYILRLRDPHLRGPPPHAPPEKD